MEKHLKNLRKSLENNEYGELKFTDQHRRGIMQRIEREYESEEAVFLAIMQLLVQERTGFDLTSKLRGRGIRRFEDNEGDIYAMLHQLEKKGYLLTRWDDQKAKHYMLNEKGRKILMKAEKKKTRKGFAYKELWEG